MERLDDKNESKMAHDGRSSAVHEEPDVKPTVRMRRLTSLSFAFRRTSGAQRSCSMRL